jgi:hypothetical protein
MKAVYMLFSRLLKGGVMGKLVNQIGLRFGKLVVVSRAGVGKNKKVLWKCVCDCGKETIAVSGSLVTGNTSSCGCLFKERVTKHGGTGKASYNTWRAMMRRCYNVLDKDYKRWGGRGIVVSLEWHDYACFVADMGEPEGDETLDRKDPYGPYSKENCRWAGVTTQNRNVRIRENSKTGIIGVSKVASGKYMAKVTVKTKSFYSKCFATLEEAALARKELERIHWSAA